MTDGPFAETKEALGGFYLIEATDLDHALAIAQALPGARTAASRCGRSWTRPAGDPAARGRRRSGAVRAAVADAHRREWAFVLAATARVAGDIDLAEECVQDAYVAALDAWLRDGVPRQAGRLAHDHRPAPRARRPAPRADAARASCRCWSSPTGRRGRREPARRGTTT